VGKALHSFPRSNARFPTDQYRRRRSPCCSIDTFCPKNRISLDCRDGYFSFMILTQVAPSRRSSNNLVFFFPELVFFCPIKGSPGVFVAARNGTDLFSELKVCSFSNPFSTKLYPPLSPGPPVPSPPPASSPPPVFFQCGRPDSRFSPRKHTPIGPSPFMMNFPRDAQWSPTGNLTDPPFFKEGKASTIAALRSLLGLKAVTPVYDPGSG